jgi:sulfotransferase family protein
MGEARLDTRRETAARGRLLVLLSSERSGSTLLRVMLGEHSRVVAPPELFLLRYAGYDAWRAAKGVAVESIQDVFRRLGTPRSAIEIDTACRGTSSLDVYRWLLDALPAGGVLVDKTPAYAGSREALARSLALEPFYVWLIRHPLGVIDSHLSLKVPAGWTGRALRAVRDRLGTLAGLAESDLTIRFRLRETKWVLQQTNVLHVLERVPRERKCVVHFEHLIRAPRAALSPLFDRLGLALEPGVLAPALKERRQNPELGDPNLHLHEGLDAGKAYEWRRRFSEDDLKPETRALMREIEVPSPEE